jgi:hypothetical protein
LKEGREEKREHAEIAIIQNERPRDGYIVYEKKSFGTEEEEHGAPD